MPVTIEPFSLTTGKRLAPLAWSTVSAVPAFNSAGSWTFTAIATPPVQALAQFDSAGNLVPFGVAIDWNGVYLMPGIAEQCTASRTTGDDGEVIEQLTFSGADALVLLANRLAWPHPAAASWAAQATTAGAYGPSHAETLIKTLITANCVSAGYAPRNYPLLDVAATAGLGDTLSWTVQPASASNDAIVATIGDSLMDIWRALAAQLTSPLGLQVTMAGTRLVADVYAPRDLSQHAVFSARLGNLSDAELDVTNPAVNALLQQTGITGAAWIEADGAGGTDPHLRVESFDDQSSVTALADAQSAQQDSLTSGVQQTSLASTAVDLPRLRFGADDPAAGITGYRLGDLVSVDLFDGLTYSDVVSAVTLTADATNGYTETVVPSIGTATDGTTISAALQRQITALERRIRRARNG
jgi:ReqiPepy6 Gp37-like protein